jgi:hypothetical protein
MNKMYLIPSFYAHVLNGLLLLIAFIMLYRNYSKLTNLEPFKLIVLTLLFSLGVGVHGMSHLGLEQNYNYNPVTYFN